MTDTASHNPADLQQAVAACIQEKKPVMLGSMAARFNVSEYDIARVLPADMRAFAPAHAFDQIWAGLADWEKATFIVEHLGSVLEIKTPIPQGTYGHGWFNLTGNSPLGGHLKMDDLKAVAFLSMPFMGLESLSLQFFNTDGAVKFSIYAGRDEQRRIIPSVRESFFRLRDALCEENN